MKKNILKIITIVIFLLIASISCQKDKHVINVIITQESLVLNVGTAKILKIIIIPLDATDKTVKWYSSDHKVATVDNGRVTAIAKGNAIITVTTNDGNHKAICSVRVIEIPEIEMVFVEGGTFTMGCTDDNCASEELPAHQVTLSNYHVSKYLVTQELWEAVMEYNPSYFQSTDSRNYPIEQVSWYDVEIFIKRLNGITGNYYCYLQKHNGNLLHAGGMKVKDIFIAAATI
jgi:hypothetical protein